MRGRFWEGEFCIILIFFPRGGRFFFQLSLGRGGFFAFLFSWSFHLFKGLRGTFIGGKGLYRIFEFFLGGQCSNSVFFRGRELFFAFCSRRIAVDAIAYYYRYYLR